MGIHTNTEDMTGNIVFFKKRSTCTDWAIATVTHGPYVHCGIVVSNDRRVISATRDGIEYTVLPDRTRYVMISLLAYDPDKNQTAWETRLKAGTQWATKQAGKQYGWLDIVDQTIDFLWPGNTLHLVDSEHWDCSDFVVRYLMEIGFPLPPTMQLPCSVSPNDLARFFGILTSVSK